MMIGYVLLALGIAIFVLSFVLPARSEEEKNTELSEEMIREMVVKEVESAKGQITDVVDETIHYAIEKTERSMDRLTNEKIMAVNEYSDTVLSDINKNHQEVVFLYDMLNDKQENLKDTVANVERKAQEVTQAVRDAELTMQELPREQVAPAPTPSVIPEKRDIYEEPPVILPQLDAGDVTVGEEEREISAGELFFGSSSDVSREPVAGNGRMSAIDRLKAVGAIAPAEAEDDFTPFAVEEKKPKPKRGRKIKVREEAVVVGDTVENRLDNGLEMIKSDAENELLSYVATKQKPEGPDLNLGENPVGKTGGRNNNDRILEMHEAGKSNMAIAKELGLGIGEVKLVIDLFEGM